MFGHPHGKKVFSLYLNGIFCISVCAHCPCAFVKLMVTVLFWHQPYWKGAEHQLDKGTLTRVVSKPWSVPHSREVVSELVSKVSRLCLQVCIGSHFYIPFALGYGTPENKGTLGTDQGPEQSAGHICVQKRHHNHDQCWSLLTVCLLKFQRPWSLLPCCMVYTKSKLPVLSQTNFPEGSVKQSSGQEDVI